MKIFSNGTDDWFPSEDGDSNGLSGKLVGFDVSSIPGGGGGSGSLSNGLNVGAGGGGGGGGMFELSFLDPRFESTGTPLDSLNGSKVAGGGAGGIV